jgi:hypothetical protein
MRLNFILSLAAIFALPFAFSSCESTPNSDPAADVDDIMVDVSDALPGLGPGREVNEHGIEVDPGY